MNYRDINTSKIAEAAFHSNVFYPCEIYKDAPEHIIKAMIELLPQCKMLLNRAKPEPVNADRDMVNQLVAYLDCPCPLFNPMTDDDPLIGAFFFFAR